MKRRLSLRRLAATAFYAVIPALTGCAAVWTRGVVQNAEGASVPDVSVSVVDDRDGKPVSATLTDFNGCFMLGPAAHGGRHFELEIRATGYKPATFAFDLETPILLVTLLPSSSEAPSEIRPATYLERSAKWEPLCIPQLPPGAQQLSP